MSIIWSVSRIALLFSSCRAFCAQEPFVTRVSKTKGSCIRPCHRNSMALSAKAVGLYRSFGDSASDALLANGFQEETLAEGTNSSPAKGMKDAEVHMTCRAWRKGETYARFALLETISSEGAGETATAGVQVFNFGIIPPTTTDIPVLGVDLVSLPGNKNLILLDAQPMSSSSRYQHYFTDWYQKHILPERFPWGGDLPEPVQRYVSPQALWTRFLRTDKDVKNKEEPNNDGEDPLAIIQGPMYEAYLEHLDLYLQMLESEDTNDSRDNWCEDYLKYRLQNDPAKPMLTSLYGAEWTQQVLETILFPKLIA